MVLDLVCGGYNCCFCEQFFEEGDGEVCYANGFYFSTWEELFEGFVGIYVGYACVEIAGAVGEFGEEGVVAWCCIISISRPKVLVGEGGKKGEGRREEGETYQ